MPAICSKQDSKLRDLNMAGASRCGNRHRQVTGVSIIVHEIQHLCRLPIRHDDMHCQLIWLVSAIAPDVLLLPSSF